jgi:hypothetical protein
VSKGLVAFIIVACLAVAVTLFTFMKRSADDARKQSDDILRDFKTIDKDFKPSSNRIDSANRQLLNAIKQDTTHAIRR